MTKRMSPDRYTVYVSRRADNKTATMQRREARRAAQLAKGVTK